MSVFLISTTTRVHSSLLIIKTSVFNFHKGLSLVPLYSSEKSLVLIFPIVLKTKKWIGNKITRIVMASSDTHVII